MRITLVGSRHFGVTTFNMLRQRGVDIVRVVVADAEDRLAAAASRSSASATTTPAISTPCWRSILNVVTPKWREPTRVIRMMVDPSCA